MESYRRPAVTPSVFYDQEGRVINYGNRWPTMPPEDSYSVEEHLERFAPLHTVAHTLIDTLQAGFDVQVIEGQHVTDGMLGAPTAHHTVRAVRFTPSSPVSAPLTIVLTDYPSVMIHAGAFFQATFPSCGCNACDEHWEQCADELEWQIQAVVEGGLTEHIGASEPPAFSRCDTGSIVVGMGRAISYELRAADGERGLGGESPVSSLPTQVFEASRARLKLVQAESPSGNWLSWPKR